MEIKIPEDFTKRAVEIKTILDEVTQQIVDQIKLVLPVGYVFDCDNSKLLIYKKYDPAPYCYHSISDAIIYQPRGSNSTHFGQFFQIQGCATSEDIFKLSPLMQLLVVIDIETLPIFKIEGVEQ